MEGGGQSHRAGEMKSFPVTVRLSVQWGDMDALGHVNNARYFTWFESARIAYFQKVGILSDKPSSLGPILRRTECDFLRPVKFPAELVVGARVTDVRNTSFIMEYAVGSVDTPDEHFARGTGVVVLVNYESGEKVNVPEEVRERIRALA